MARPKAVEGGTETETMSQQADHLASAQEEDETVFEQNPASPVGPDTPVSKLIKVAVELQQELTSPDDQSLESSDETVFEPDAGQSIPAGDRNHTEAKPKSKKFFGKPKVNISKPQVSPNEQSASTSAASTGLLGAFIQHLIVSGVLPERKAVSIALKARERDETVWRTLIADSSISNVDDLCREAAQALGTLFIEDKLALLNEVEATDWLPPNVALQRGVLVIKSDDPSVCTYAAYDPFDLFAKNWVSRTSGKPAQPVVVSPRVFLEVIGRLRRHGDEQKTRSDYLVPVDVNWEKTERAIGNSDVNQVPAIVDFLLHKSIEHSASDLHVEPAEDALITRIRVDGLLQELTRLPKNLHAPLVSRIKILSGMDVAERRRPQDGRISAVIRKTPIDIRVSSFPTVGGEKIAMRLLDEDALRPTPEMLGLRNESLRLFLDKINNPHGLIFVGGPTGAGKTTTLYSCLTAVDRENRHVVTIEDPVEYRLQGVHQMQTNDKIGLTFAAGLRTILRQDPDVIMVGECRDVQTAELAVQASLTGHVVFSTIHANDAVGVVSRLLDMGVEPFLVASALSLTVSQRLVRSVCRECAVSISGSEMLGILQTEGVSEGKIESLGIELDSNTPLVHPTGCASCRHTGYSGRQAVFELLDIDHHMRELIASTNFSTEDMRQQAKDLGMSTMLNHAVELVEEGATTLTEVIRVFGDGQT